MKDTKKINDMLCKELEEITSEGKMSAGNLDAIYKLIVSMEKLARLEEIEGKGYSKDSYYSRSMDGSYRDDSYDDGNYSGRHYVRGHYSRADEGMQEIIDRLMQDPKTPLREKETLTRAMEILNR